jgi:hypothetical protein
MIAMFSIPVHMPNTYNICIYMNTYTRNCGCGYLSWHARGRIDMRGSHMTLPVHTMVASVVFSNFICIRQHLCRRVYTYTHALARKRVNRRLNGRLPPRLRPD